MIDHEKCVGCRTCEVACSVGHEGVINTVRSRITIIRGETEGEGIPITCTQCESAPCESICPVAAISRDNSLGVVIDYDRCIGCRMCIAVCPFGAVSFDSVGRRVVKCDLCDGDPLCVTFCMYGALKYIEAGEQSALKQRQAAARLKEVTGAVRRPASPK
jgi:carbon-monoxide dehydrogenase iron sulfur subunit